MRSKIGFQKDDRHAGSRVYSFGLFPLLDHGEVDELALLPVLVALLAVLGGQFNSIFLA